MHPHQNTSRRHSTPAIPYTSSPSPAAYAQTLISRQNISYPSSYPPHSAFPSSRPDLRDEISGSQREIVSGHSRSEWPGSVHPITASPFIGSVISQAVPGVRGEYPGNPDSRSRWTTRPLPSQQTSGSGEVSLHGALIYPTEPMRLELITLDIATLSMTSIRRMAKSTLCQPATWPRVPSINLICPELPWSITVHAMTGTEGGCVTIADVLCAICYSLHLPLSREDWSHCRPLGEEPFERNLRRLHLLHGKTRFAGLSRSTAERRVGAEIWRVHFL